MITTKKSRSLFQLMGVAAVAATMSGLAGPCVASTSDALAKVTSQPDIAALVPQGVRDKGEIIFVMTTSSPPSHFTADSGVMEGSDPDLALAIAKVFNLKAKIVGVPQDQIIPGLQSHRYDAVISQFNPTKARGKVLDFVNYTTAGNGIAVAAGNPKHLTADTLCGMRVGVGKASAQAVKVVPKLSDKCVKEGKKPIDMQTYLDPSTEALAIKSERIDAMVANSPTIGYLVKHADYLTFIDTLDSLPAGIGTVKGTSFPKAFQKAMTYLSDQGVYQDILKKWGDDAGIIKDFAINQYQ